MNHNMHDRSSFYIVGKEFVIVFVVVFSAASFTLGYLVGKSVHADREQTLWEVPKDRSAQSDNGTVHAQNSEAPVIAVREFVPSEHPETPALPGSKAAPSVERSSSAVKNTFAEATNEETNDPIVYTVQVGAFKNSKDADNFMEKYQNKGYSTYISVFRNASDENIYKVRMGSFKTRKEADLFSVKLKKNEGVSAFVTFKKD